MQSGNQQAFRRSPDRPEADAGGKLLGAVIVVARDSTVCSTSLPAAIGAASKSSAGAAAGVARAQGTSADASDPILAEVERGEGDRARVFPAAGDWPPRRAWPRTLERGSPSRLGRGGPPRARRHAER